MNSAPPQPPVTAAAPATAPAALSAAPSCMADAVPPPPAPPPAVPPESPLSMPVQDFRADPPQGPARQPAAPAVRAARLIAFGGTAVVTGLGCWQMLLVFGDRIQPLQYALLGLFTLTFAWVGFSFCSMLAGLVARQPQTPDDPGDARVAVVMPIYHEDAGDCMGLLAALADELAAAGLGARAEIFVLSDSRDPAFFADETLAVAALRAAAPVPVWYRRRIENTGRKAGNIAEFVRRWGGRYDQMVVLDADSVVSGQVIAAMSARMAADPALALIQTIPMLTGGQTIFSRVTQFAGRFYGPPIARGVAAWSGDNGNFWGHNAMIRVAAFAQCCGLPDLPGDPPWGGTVLSHDFVEAALLARAGWAVRLDWDLRASYEGSPPTLLDMAVRERRWAQGNLQHLRLIGARGFTWVSRVHFVIGVLGFVMSPVWLAMILVGMALTANVILSQPQYFPSTFQLFPDWPTFDAARMKWLFAAAMALLLLPKVLAIGRAWRRPLAAASGGRSRVLASALFETVMSALIAPVQMLIQTRQILEILQGRNSGWESQVRKGSMPPWPLVLRRHWLHVAVGLVTLVILALLSPGQLIWLAPILAGLILAPLTSRWSASAVLGRWARLAGLLVTPEERSPPPILSAAVAHARRLRPPADATLALGRDEAVRAAHVALLPPLPDRPAAQRLPAIAAAAKIDAAVSQRQALDFLDRAERAALLSEPALLDRWAALPE
ncbi:glucans biosynthesis glucosyltransferase MdoH [Paracoccus endophyticus]|uniref:glucans biosynthesis glucosyltransferase MdoH n=1 Tax=Paracoccus endophyticus TaxID=2233774 RepID=UPI000DD72503|nr:glucans biosynthesis glucosyltransferase MdoH [Paracoccus endophyticus]